MRNTEEVNDILAAFHDCVVSGKPSADYDGHTGNLKVGVDLGTSSIVLAVVDQKGRPVLALSRKAKYPIPPMKLPAAPI